MILAALREAQYAGAGHGVVLSSGGEVEALLNPLALGLEGDGYPGGCGPAGYPRIADLAAGLRVCACCAVAGDEAEAEAAGATFPAPPLAAAPPWVL